MEINEIIKNVFLGIDIFIIVVMALYVLMGFLKGWKKSVLRLIAFLVPFLLIVCFSGVAAKALLNISLPEIGTIKDYMTTQLSQSINNGQDLGGETYALCEAIVVAVFRVVAYFVGLILVTFIIAPINRLILALIFNKGIKKAGKPMSSRLFGLIAGFGRFAVFFIVWMLPLFGILNFANMAINDIAQITPLMTQESSKEVNVSEETTIDDTFKMIQEGLESSNTNKFMNISASKKTGINVAGAYLSSLVSVKTSHGSFNLLNEYGNLRRVFPIVATIISNNDGNLSMSFDNVTDDQIDTLGDVIKDIKMFDIIAPVVKEIGVATLSAQYGEEYKDEIATFNEIDITDELHVVLNTLGEAVKSLKGIVIDMENPQNVLLSPNLPNSISSVLSELLKSNIINKIVLPKVSGMLIEQLVKDNTSNNQVIKDLLSSNNIKAFLVNDIKSFLQIYQDLCNNANLDGFIFKQEKLDIYSEKATDAIAGSLEKLFTLSAIEGRENGLIKLLLDNIGLEGVTYETIFQNITPNWEEEAHNFSQIAKEALVILSPYMEEGFDKFDPLKLLEQKEDGTFVIEPLILKIASSNLIKSIALNFLDNNKSKLQSEEINSEFIESINFDNLRNLTGEEFKDEIVNILDIIRILKDMNIVFAAEGQEMLITSENIEKLVPKIFNSIIVRGNEEQIVRLILGFVNIEGLSYDEIFEGLDIDWSVENTKLTTVIVELIKLVGTDFNSLNVNTFIGVDDQNKFLAEPLILAVADSDLLRLITINYLEKNITGYNADEQMKPMLDCLNFETLKSLSSAQFKNEVMNILNTLRVLVDMKILFAQEGEEIILSQENITKLVTNIFNSALIKGNEQTIFNYILETTSLNKTLEENEITLDLTLVNWETEPTKLVNVFTALMNFGNLENVDLENLMEDRSQTAKIVTLCDALSASDIFGPAIYSLIEKMVSVTGYNVVISEADKTAIKTNGWQNEFDSLYYIIDHTNTIFNSENGYTNINGSEVTSIMVKASESVIATKIVGGMLNTVLGPDNLNIFPTNPDGTPKYDFMDPATLNSAANDIGALIDLKNQMDNFNLESADATENIGEIVSSIATLAGSEMVNDIIGSIVGEEVAGTVDFANEANVVEDVYNAYNADPDNFDLSSNPELEQKVQDSEIASSILHLLGILS